MHTVVRQHRRRRADRGMSTAEYAVGMIAACGFAALLHRILTSDDIGQALAELVSRALRLAG